jgi:hypothetical protein
MESDSSPVVVAASEASDRLWGEDSSSGNRRVDTATEQRDTAAEERDTAADERDSAAEERDSAAEERDTATDERETATDERERADGLSISEHEQAARDRKGAARD